MKTIVDIANVYYNQAIKLIEEKDITNAIKQLIKSSKIFSKDKDVWNLLGLCYYYSCDFESANRCWRQSLIIGEHSNIASDYLKQFESAEFINLIQLYNQALETLKTVEMSKSISLLKKIINDNQQFIEPYIILGLVYYKLGNYDESIKYLEIASSKDQGNQQLMKYISITKAEMTSIVSRKASNQWKALLAGSFIILLFIGYGFFNYQQKIHLLTERNIKIEKEFSQNKIQLQNNIQKNMALENRLVEFGLASDLKVESLNEKILFNEGIKLYRNSKYEAALPIFNQIINFGVNQKYIYESLFFAANSFVKVGNVEQGILYYRKYINEYPTGNYYDDSLYNCGILLYNAGKQEEAEILLTTLVQEKPESIFVNSNVRSILSK